MSESERVDSLVESRAVKMLLFRPSGRRLWAVVGRDSEHWADPELGFCTCKDFYFSTLSGGDPCYHLKSVRKAMDGEKAETVEFADDEYDQLLQETAQDSEMLLR
jgi:predicted nucleic acid-binding Zn finger protein